MEKLMTLFGILFQKLLADTKKWTAALEKFLREENPWEVVKQPSPKIWKTIKLGTHEYLNDLVKAVEAAGAKISDWAKELLRGATLAKKETEIDLVILSVAELGYGEGASYRQVCKAAKARGYELCPAEVGLQLRRQYQDQPLGELLIIAMKPISDSGGGPNLFGVGRGVDGRWLGGNYGGFWGPGVRFVFRLRK